MSARSLRVFCLHKANKSTTKHPLPLYLSFLHSYTHKIWLYSLFNFMQIFPPRNAMQPKNPDANMNAGEMLNFVPRVTMSPCHVKNGKRKTFPTHNSFISLAKYFSLNDNRQRATARPRSVWKFQWIPSSELNAPEICEMSKSIELKYLQNGERKV